MISAEGERGGLLMERDREVERIGGCLGRAAQRRGGALVVEGPVGIGKTVLLGPAARCGCSRFSGVAGAGAELEREFALGVVRQMVEPVVAAASEQERAGLLDGPPGAVKKRRPSVVGLLDKSLEDGENSVRSWPTVGSLVWGQEIAEAYDTINAPLARAGVVGPMVDVLAELADGPALEFAIGTGRVALPLSARGINVQGIELSQHMAAQLQKKPGADGVAVTIGDMTSTRVPGSFRLVYLVANTIMNVTTQDEQVAVFVNASAHLALGGCFVVEVIVPQLREVPPGARGRVFTLEPDHVGIETFDDLVGQIAWSHHWVEVSGRLVHHSGPFRYVWPSELDLMARLGGFRLRERWAGWDRSPFTSESPSQVAVFEKEAPPLLRQGP